MANFLSTFSYFRYNGNMGWSETNFTYTAKFADPKNALLGARNRSIPPIEASYISYRIYTVNHKKGTPFILRITWPNVDQTVQYLAEM